VAVGDFNGDARPDLAIANQFSNNVSVLLGTGTGNFAAAASSPEPVGARPRWVAVGDFNGDGRPDLATADAVSSNVSVLLGDGTGNFAAAAGSPEPVGAQPFSVAVGDFNGDGKPDLATANFFSNTATVLLGDGTGNFATAASSPEPVGTQPQSVAVGDFNGDGKPDLATANSGQFSNNVSVLLNIGDQPSLPAVVRSSTTWFLGATQNGLCCAASFVYGVKPLVPFIGDWDGNGSRTAGTFENGTFKLNNANDNSAADITFTFGDRRGFPVAGDFDGNGIDDVAVFRNGVWQIRLSDGTVLPQFSWGSGSWPATIPLSGDWDGNGSDGIGTYTYSSAVWNLRNAADGNGGGDAGSFVYGTANSSYPVVGDWNVDAIHTVGLKTGQTWTLRNTNAPGAPDVTPFLFGDPTLDLPLSWSR
jgi:hypothetical protein